MVYFMKIRVDGACRNNGRNDAIGTAAAVVEKKWGRTATYTRTLPRYPPPTNQRAEMTAIILALELAVEKLQELETSPRMIVHIFSDSKYAVNCMDTWLGKWQNNGWMNSAGYEVANRDLIERASDLADEIDVQGGEVDYIWIPRSENYMADQACNEALDKC